jgi:threonine aldolase
MIDLRSDTVTLPTDAMRAAMASARRSATTSTARTRASTCCGLHALEHHVAARKCW